MQMIKRDGKIYWRVSADDVKELPEKEKILAMKVSQSGLKPDSSTEVLEEEEPEKDENADLNEDGVIDLKDFLILKKYGADIITELPYKEPML